MAVNICVQETINGPNGQFMGSREVRSPSGQIMPTNKANFGRTANLCLQAHEARAALMVGGPAWIRTKDQGIHVAEAFPPRVDYLFTLGY